MGRAEVSELINEDVNKSMMVCVKGFVHDLQQKIRAGTINRLIDQ